MPTDPTNPVPTTQTGFRPLPDENSGSGVQPLAQVATTQIAVTEDEVTKFGIPTALLQKNPVLVDLILKTESMQDEERKYWFALLPNMTAEQVTKLQNILQNERDQLAALDAKYDSEIQKLNEKHAMEEAARAAAEKRKKLESAEQKHEATEKDAEADVLNQIEGI